MPRRRGRDHEGQVIAVVDLNQNISFGSFGRKKESGAAAPDPGASEGSPGSGRRATRGGRSKVVYPTKTTINLVKQEAAQGNIAVQVGLFLVVIVLIGVFAKFAVVDPLASGLDSSAQVSAAQAQLNELVAANENYAALNEKYARYVVTGLTDDELSLADRNALLDLIRSNLMSVGYLSSVKVVGNTVTATCLGVDLTEVSRLVERLESDSRVSHVTVSTAQGKDDAGTSATIEVTLKDALDTEAGAAAGGAGAAASGTAAGEGAGNGAA